MRLLSSTALLLVVLTSSYLEAATTAPTPSGSASCGGMCQARCSKASLQSRCLKVCGHCCALCSCVPSGTYGNKDECPCYRDMRTKKNKPKCP